MQFMPCCWFMDIWFALQELGGEAGLPKIYRVIKRTRQQPLPKNFESVIRAELQHYCADAKQYQKGYPNMFKNTARGWWAIRSVTEKLSPDLPLPEMRQFALYLMLSNPTECKQLQNAASSTSADAFTSLLDQKIDTIKRELSGGKKPSDYEAMIAAGLAKTIRPTA